MSYAGARRYSEYLEYDSQSAWDSSIRYDASAAYLKAVDNDLPVIPMASQKKNKSLEFPFVQNERFNRLSKHSTTDLAASITQQIRYPIFVYGAIVFIFGLVVLGSGLIAASNLVSLVGSVILTIGSVMISMFVMKNGDEEFCD